MEALLNFLNCRKGKVNIMMWWFWVKTGMKNVTRRLRIDNKGMGVVEIILIIVVLVSLVIIFKTQMTSIVNSIFTTMKTKIKTV